MIDPAHLRDVFDRAACLPQQDRAAFLERACGDNSALRREVDRLLAADARFGSAFNTAESSDLSDGAETATVVSPSRRFSLAIGARLGPYEITAVLGAGGMGEVYKARDTRLDRTVAVKVLAKDLVAAPDARRRFEREARAAAALAHPHICRVLDVGRQGELDFLVMEHLEGETLAARLQRGKLPLSQALSVGIQIADALATAHRAGIVHRDLKPGNIMLTHGGAMLLDFGLARQARSVTTDGRTAPAHEPMTATGAILGTVQYMAPEQLQGFTVDARTDIFALGLVLYEMVTGRHAFEGASHASVIGNILHTDPLALTSIDPMTPPALDRVVRKCLAKDPGDRWQAASDVQARLEALHDVTREGSAVAGSAEDQSVRSGDGGVDIKRDADQRVVWKRRGLRYAAAGIAGLALAVGAWSLYHRSARPVSASLAPAQRNMARLNGGGSATFSPDGAVLPPMTTVPLTSLAGTEGSPSFSPDGTRVAFDWRPAGAAESRIVVKGVGDDALQELTRGANDGSPAWSPDGRWIAFARGDGDRSGLYIVPAIGGRVRRLYPGRLYYGPSWSPDSRTLVFSAPFPEPCRIFSLSLETLEARPLTSTKTWDISPAFSPDGRTIAFVRDSGYAGDLYLVAAGGGELRRLTFDDKAIDGRPAWTEDGASILFVSSRAGSPELWRVAAEGGTPERLPIASTAVSDIALDRTGRRLAYVQGRATDRMRIRALDLRRPATPPVDILESSRSDNSPTFSRDGKRIAFASNRGGEASNIWIADADGSNPVRLTNFTQGFSGSPGWSPDGEWVAFDSRAEGQNGIFVVRVAGGAPRRLTSGRANDFAPSWSKDGRWIYFGSNRGGKDQVWKTPVAGGEALQITTNGGGCALESSDGRWLYYTKSNGQDGIWRVPPQGGLEEPVLDGLPSGWYNRYWALVENGIYYLNTRISNRQSVEFLSFSTHKVTRIFDLPEPAGPDWSSSFAVSPDERTLLTVFIAQGATDIMLVENFQSFPAASAAPR